MLSLMSLEKMILAQENCEINMLEGMNLRFDSFIVCKFLIHVHKELRRTNLNGFDEFGEYIRLPLCF